MKIKLLFLMFFSIIAIYGKTPLALAQQENDSLIQEDADASNSATTSGSIIKKIIKDNLANDKVKGAIDNLLNRKIAMIGQLSRITDETITIKNLAGTKILALDNNPKIIKDKKTIDIDKVEVENWVMVLGKLKDDNFSPDFIYVYTKTLRPKNQVILIGTITSITNSTITIKPRSGDQEETLNLTNNTKFRDSAGKESTFNNFSEDINVLVIGLEDNDSKTATTIRSLAPLPADE